MKNFYQLSFCLFLCACNQGVSGCSSSDIVFDDKDKIQSAIQLRVTEEGLTFLGDQISPLIEEALPDTLNTCLAGNNNYCSQNQCANGQTGCDIAIGIGDVNITAIEPDKIRAQITLEQLALLLDVNIPLVDCDINITSPSFPVNVDLTLSTPEPERNLRFKLENADYELSNLDIRLQGTTLCDIVDGVINVPVLGDFILDLIEASINNILVGTIQILLNQYLCIPCDSPENEMQCQRAGGQCVLGQCVDPNVFGACMAKPLGLSGELNVGDLLSSISPSTSGKLDYFVNPGSYAKVEESGLSLGVIAGTHPIPNRCVSPLPSPPTTEVPRAMAFSSNVDPSGQPFDVGIGISQRFLDQALWSVQQSGALCISVSGESIDLLNTRTLQVLLPSLTKLTRGAVPAAVALSPQQAPKIKLGENLIVQNNIDQDPVVQEPLLTLVWEQLWIDFYAFTDDRWTRLFSLKADLNLPIALDFDGMGQIIPMVGDVTRALSNVEIANAELLLDDPSRISMLLPSLIGPIVGGALSSLSDPIALPELMGISLVLRDGSIKGLKEGDNEFLAIFADLNRATMAMSGNKALNEQEQQKQAQTKLSLLEVKAIHPDQFFQYGLQSSVRFKTEALTAFENQQLEYSWKIDQQAWHPFTKAIWDPQLEAGILNIQDPAFLLQGKHQIQLRARYRATPQSVDAIPLQFEILMDAVEPELKLEAQRDKIYIQAQDLITPKSKLKGKYRWDNQAWQDLSTYEAEPAGFTDFTESEKAFIQAWQIEKLGNRLEVVISDEANQSKQQALVLEHEQQALIGRPDPNAPASSGAGCACHQLPTAHAHPHFNISDLLPIAFLLLLSRRFREKLLQLAKKLSGLFGFFLLLSISSVNYGCEDNNKGKPKGEVEDQGLMTNPCASCTATQICVDNACVAQNCTLDPSVCQAMSCGEGQLVQCGMQGVCECADEPLCPMGCEEGKYCCFSRNACEAIKAPTCPDLNCPVGQKEAVVDAGEMNADRCELEGVMCECQDLPDLPLGAIGRFSDLFVLNNIAYISAYSDDYGDLVVGTGTVTDGIKWMWVDGIPSMGTVEGNLNGPRKGIKAAGTNVGKYTSLVVDDDQNIHVVYQDVDQNALKYARGSKAGNDYQWQSYQLAEGAGKWAELALNGNQLSLAYRKELASVEGQIPTALVYRLSNSLTPMGASDWQDEQILHEVSYPDTAMSSTYPEGTALFTDLHWQADQSKVGLSWYDRSHGDFYFIEGNQVDGFTEPQLLAGWSHMTIRGDMGANGAFAYDAQNQPHFCYQDGSKDNLRYLVPSAAIDEEVDDGIRLATDGRERALHVVGDDCQILFDNQGNALIIYQDATSHELLLARRDSTGNWTKLYLRQQNQARTTYMGQGFGFFAKATWVGNDLWISHFVYNTQTMPASQGIELFNFRAQ